MKMMKYAMVGAVVMAGAATARAEDLYSALAYTYDSNPSILSQRTYLKSLDENMALALSGYRPTLSASGDIYVVDADDYNATPKSIGASANQNLFQGFNTMANTKAAEHQIRAGRYQLLSVEQNILTQAATAYVDVLRDEAVLRLQINNEQVLQRELETNRNRFAVGEITRTDLSQSESRLSGAKAARIQAEGNLQASRANYFAVIGKMPETMVAPEPLDMLMPQTLADARDIADKANPDLIAAKYSQRSLNDNIMVQKSSLLPSLDLKASAGKSWDVGQYDIDSRELRAGAVLSVPLYDAGADRARIRNAKQLANQGKIDIEQVRRTVQQNLASNWEMLKASKAQIVSIQAQIKASELALEGVKQEFLVGARTVLDVLNAEQDLLDARVSLVKAMHEETVMSFQVLANLGRMTPTYLSLKVTPYDPVENYKDTKYKWLGTGVE